MKTLEVSQIIAFHKKIVKATGGSDGIRDLGLIESALNKAFATFDGHDLYEGILKKISVLSFSIIKNHGFIDGNKRVGVATMLLLLRLNGITIKYSQEDLIEIGLKTAEGIYKEEDIEQWILRHQV
ncbi:type II toxin-antitoxin system death-on-curing family toxin [Paenibacillus sp. SI8]|uniref:type II toxin-antitoxin system death-on-curing family toxin n=1 Tax=unclassified Paenibacillus TaxID=185978 RepID=UPI0034652423